MCACSHSTKNGGWNSDIDIISSLSFAYFGKKKEEKKKELNTHPIKTTLFD